MQALVTEQAIKKTQSVMTGLRNSNPEALNQLPVESLLPMIVLKHVATLSGSLDFSKDYMEFGFDPE
jgi:hypothetical protein